MIGCPRLSVSWLGHLPRGLGVLTRRQCVNCGPSSSHVQGHISNPKPFPPLPLSGAQPELEAVTRLGEQTECPMGPCPILELRWGPGGASPAPGLCLPLCLQFYIMSFSLLRLRRHQMGKMVPAATWLLCGVLVCCFPPADLG